MSTVRQLSDGKFQARAYVRGQQQSVGIYETEDDARHWAHKFETAQPKTMTLRAWAELALHRREQAGVRDAGGDRGRWKRYVSTEKWLDLPLHAVTQAHVSAWARDLGAKHEISRLTVQRALTTLSGVFREAQIDLKRSDNPTTGIVLRKETKVRTVEPWTFLTAEEQRAIVRCEAIPEHARCLMRFAWGTGLRQGEQWNLPLSDLRLEGQPRLVVRFGSKGQVPKSGKERTIPLFGEGLAAAKRWLELLPSYAPANPLGLVFPTERGKLRRPQAPSELRRVAPYWLSGSKKTSERRFLLPAWLAAAGITRHVRWHDLRHTCASSLVSGAWGRAWSLEQVKGYMGHSSISVTERYAHLSGDALLAAALGMVAL